MNEYHIYSKTIGNNLDKNNLLAMIVYKNIYPNDFTLLSNNKGNMYKIIHSKTQYIQTVINDFDGQIKTLKDKIAQIENQQITDLKELRILYISKVVEQITNGFVAFHVNGKQVSISNFTTDEYFAIIKSGNIQYYHYDSYIRNNIDVFSFNFMDIENNVNKDLRYEQRETLALSKNKINLIKQEIEQIEKKKLETRNSKLKDLISNKKISVELGNNSDLIDVLLRYGYINENYLDYISIFHEGALTKADYLFLRNVKRELSTDFEYHLRKTNELIKRISEFTFEKEYILNYDLADAILMLKDSKSKRDIFFKQLSNEQDTTIKFIDGYINYTQHIKPFFEELCLKWSDFWRYILFKTSYTDEKKEKYFLFIIKYATIDSIEK